MSLNPVFAAAIGAAVLGQALGLLDGIAIGVIVIANVGAVLATRPRGRAESPVYASISDAPRAASASLPRG